MLVYVMDKDVARFMHRSYKVLRRLVSMGGGAYSVSSRSNRGSARFKNGFIFGIRVICIGIIVVLLTCVYFVSLKEVWRN